MSRRLALTRHSIAIATLALACQSEPAANDNPPPLDTSSDTNGTDTPYPNVSPSVSPTSGSGNTASTDDTSGSPSMVAPTVAPPGNGTSASSDTATDMTDTPPGTGTDDGASGTSDANDSTSPDTGLETTDTSSAEGSTAVSDPDAGLQSPDSATSTTDTDEPDEPLPTVDAPTLAAKFANHFAVGAAVDTSYQNHSQLLEAHFNSITAENEMKFESLQPNEGSFTYAAADSIVDYALSHDMQVRGHALVWHTQNPSWLFSGNGGGNASPEQLLARMRSHISNVVTHFRGKVAVWDVVNEAIMNDGAYRGPNEPDGQQSKWYEIMGSSYIAEAFHAAHEADPDAKLFYNDFYNYIPEKHEAIYEMAKQLLSDGVPIHGIGLQCHINIEPSTDPSNQAYHQHVANLEKAIELYSSLGLEVHVTELDVSVYTPGITYTEDTFVRPETFTADMQAAQAARYQEFFELFVRQHRAISSVTFWGVADDNTWLSEFSSGRQDFPLLFDSDHDPKPAFDAVMSL